MDTQCQGAYALKEFSSQTLSSRIDRNTEFKFLQLEGEIDKDVEVLRYLLKCLCHNPLVCHMASFRDAQCQGADFRDAQCQGADFALAQCQGNP
jgi:uncharacterized protein YjbI with pentapeptide repeats